MQILFKIYRRLAKPLLLPFFVAEYFDGNTGKEYGIGFLQKLNLLVRMIRNTKRITTASNFLEHLAMATRILNIPRSVEGCVVECGSYKGGSATNLSLVCAICRRELQIFDSFEGLPEPSERDRAHLLVSLRVVHTYARGSWSGSLEEVSRNISRFGAVDVCTFNVGYFEHTLPRFDRKCVFAFIDVDLVDSLETCLKALWPMLQDGCFLFTHEAPHLEISSLFFDREWWRENLNSIPPGLIGAGTGLGLVPKADGFQSDIGYTVKSAFKLTVREEEQTGARTAGRR